MSKLNFLLISIAEQRLYGFTGVDEVVCMPVSTALKGAGERNGSGCTPRGWHRIRACIGKDLPLNAVLRARRWTGEIWTPELHQAFPGRDWILTRILWLSGAEVGVNRLGSVDTFRRYIYLHGTPDTEPMGLPLSHGCIRKRNHDIAELFERVDPGCAVFITEDVLTPLLRQTLKDFL